MPVKHEEVLEVSEPVGAGQRRAEQLISTTGNSDGVGHGEPALHGLDHLWKQVGICRSCS